MLISFTIDITQMLVSVKVAFVNTSEMLDQILRQPVVGLGWHAELSITGSVDKSQQCNSLWTILSGQSKFSESLLLIETMLIRLDAP